MCILLFIHIGIREKSYNWLTLVCTQFAMTSKTFCQIFTPFICILLSFFCFCLFCKSLSDKANAQCRFNVFIFKLLKLKYWQCMWKNNAKKTRKLIICNIVPSMPFLLLFFYLWGAFDRFITSINFVKYFFPLKIFEFSIYFFEPQFQK
jgi:ABC-type dipeptide/oligopeptide/nickel transport system permease subunit